MRLRRRQTETCGAPPGLGHITHPRVTTPSFWRRLSNFLSNFWKRSVLLPFLNGLKTFSVYMLGQNTLLWAATKGIPVGGWIIEGEDWSDPLLNRAIGEGDLKKVENLIKMLPPHHLKQYLAHLNTAERPGLEEGLFALKIGLDLEEGSGRKEDFTRRRIKILVHLIDAMPLEERLTWLSTQSDDFLMTLLRDGEISALLAQWPPEQLMECFRRKNSFGRTRLMEWVLRNCPESVEQFLSLFPSDPRQRFLACQGQGEKAMWVAHALGHIQLIAVLEKYGVSSLSFRVSDEEKEIMLSEGRPLVQEKRPKRNGEQRLIMPKELFAQIRELATEGPGMGIKDREKKAARLENWGITLPKNIIRFKTLLDTLEKWTVMAHLEQKGIPFSEVLSLEALKKKLPWKINSREIEPQIKKFEATFGVHPAEAVGLPKEKREDLKAIEERLKYWLCVLERVPSDKKHAPRIAKTTEAMLTAHALYEQYSGEARKTLRKQVRQNWRGIPLKARFDKQLCSLML